ncbi:hypothetical protein EXW32_30130 (plasmid) [Bacillus mycoides]|uniref:hypothetical protein n=1 Tax=Bacillus TaxID=1386 RepID=UPI001C03581D|nr:hypothetical protein [Bacillus mycoides]QWG70580.1 hypothetical protein EXW32_30130 [Bacillus mycoides]
MLRLKFVCFLLPLILFVSGCGNTAEETKYEKDFLTQVKAISKTVGKMTEVQKNDQSLSSSQEEYKEAVMELKGGIKGFKDLVPDSKYEAQHKKLINAMDEYELSISKLLTGMSNTEGTEWIEGIKQFNKATDLYVIAAGNIVDIRDGNKVGTTEGGIEKISEQGDTQTEAEAESTQTQPSEQEADVATKDTQTQPTEQQAEAKVAAADAEPAVEQSQQQLTVDKVKEIFEYYSIGENDKLNNVSVENGEIKATIVLAPNSLFPAKDMAVNRYSQISDELLKHEGWQKLTVTYANIGTVSMNRNEKETNEVGDYFPTLKIEERMK